MRTNCFLTIVAALCLPVAAWAQANAPKTSETDAEAPETVLPARTIPKVEFSFGGGAGIGGYLATFSGDPWLTHVGQTPAVMADYTTYYLPKASLMPAGHAGFWVDFNFTEHWGFITGAELGFYQSKLASQMLLNVTTNVITSKGSAGEYQRDLWIASNLPDFQEQHRMFAVQVPLMIKYMTPVSPQKGHQFYLAAGAKVGLNLIAQYAQQWGAGKYDIFAETEVPSDGSHCLYLNTYNNGDTRINHYLEYGLLQSTTITKEDAAWNRAKWSMLETNPLDVMASIDLGFRWNLGNGKGLYTGLYCDFGLLRPIARRTGRKVLNFASRNIAYQLPQTDAAQPYGHKALVSLAGSTKVSALAADAPDYAYLTIDEPEGQDPVMDVFMIKNSDPFAKTLNKMQAGVKVRFAFGRVGARPKKVKTPKVKPVKEPDPPTVVPDDIQQTMIRLSNALFAFDKFDLNQEARTMLDEVVGWLKEYPNLNVEIGGHTDNMGSDDYNQKLSENRAKAVYDYFVQHGVAAERLSYKGYGESRPIATNETSEGRQANRRVELQIKQ